MVEWFDRTDPARKLKLIGLMCDKTYKPRGGLRVYIIGTPYHKDRNQIDEGKPVYKVVGFKNLYEFIASKS